MIVFRALDTYVVQYFDCRVYLSGINLSVVLQK